MRKADFLLMLHTATRLTLMLCILFREEFSLFLLIQESCMFLAQISTLLTPSFGNHLFAYHLVLKHPLTNMTLSSFCIPKVVKSATKNWFINKN